MAGNTQPPTDVDELEATPEFNEKCITIVRQWERGELPYKNAVAELEGYAQEAISEYHPANQARVEHAIAYIEHYRGKHSISIQRYDRARKLYKQLGNQERIAIIDLNQGENYRFKGDFTRALRLYRSAYETAERLGNIRVQTIAAVNEGLTLLAVDQNNSARRAFDAGLKLADQWDEDLDVLPGLLCEVYHGMAKIHLDNDDLRAAWDDGLKALEAANESKQPLQAGYANRVIGVIISKLGESPDPNFSSDPDIYFNEAISAFREINAEAEIARTMYEQARSMAIRGRRTMAARKLQHVMVVFTRLDMAHDAARAAEAQLAVT
jgi:tetratricopeptide (TPR) repeat protein